MTTLWSVLFLTVLLSIHICTDASPSSTEDSDENVFDNVLDIISLVEAFAKGVSPSGDVPLLLVFQKSVTIARISGPIIKSCFTRTPGEFLIIDGVVAFVTIGKAGYEYYDGRRTLEDFRLTVNRRIYAAFGSVGMSAAGAYAGTLLLPGVGTSIGTVVGGVAGDYMGSWLGGKITASWLGGTETYLKTRLILRQALLADAPAENSAHIPDPITKKDP